MNLTEPTELATPPPASGVPTVTSLDVCTGGLHEGNASGGPCVRFELVHCANAGTSETLNGLAPFGRTYPVAT